MLRLLIVAAALALPMASHAATVSAKVRHMCCGACKGAATAGLQGLPWAASVAVENDVVTVTVKDGMTADLMGLITALSKTGFPATEITTAGSVTLTMAHLCCPGCVNDLKAKMGEINSMTLDKEKVTIDATAKTMTLSPVAGKQLNVAALVRQIEQRTGFSPSKVVAN